MIPLIPDAPFRVDVHCHHIPDFYRAALAEVGITTAGGIPIPAWTPQLAVGFMNNYGIQTQVVSISEPGVTPLPTPSARLTLARQVNDYTREALVTTTDSSLTKRFGGFAVLPLGDLSKQDVANACLEAERAMNVLGLDGIGLLSNYNGAYLGDRRLDPLMRVLNKLGAMVFVHPVTPPRYPNLNQPTFLYEFPFDTTRAATSMAYRQIFVRFPQIRWLLAHAGGTLPAMADKTRLPLRYPETMPRLAKIKFNRRNLNYSKLFYDTALSQAPASMKAVLDIAPRSQVLFASDWPFSKQIFILPGDPAPQLSHTFTAAQRVEVERTNALAQLPRLAARLGA